MKPSNLNAPWYNRLVDQLNRLESQAREARIEQRRLADDVLQLRHLCEALWSALHERGDLTEEQSARILASIPDRSGESPARTCPACARPNASSATSCLYCQAPLG